MVFSSPTGDNVAESFSGNLADKVAVVTGSSRGIGKEVARILASKGARVIMANRNIETAETAAKDIRQKLGEATSGTVEVMKLDLSDLESVRDFVEKFKALGKPLDILVLNAGIISRKHRLSPQGFELQFATNHLGHFMLAYLLLDELKGANGARVVAVTSRTHLKSKGNWDWPSEGDKGFGSSQKSKYSRLKAYGETKAANIMFARELSKRFAENNIFACSVNPGTVKTNIVRDLGPVLGFFYEALAPLILKTPNQGTAGIIRGVLDENLTQGVYLVPTLSGPKVKVPKAETCLNDSDCSRLWDESQKIVDEFLRTCKEE